MNENKSFFGGLIQMIILSALVVLGIYIYYEYFDGQSIADIKDEIEDVIHDTDSLIQNNNPNQIVEELDNYLPRSEGDIIVNHRFYTLSYSEKDEQAKWVAFELTKSRVNSFIAKRTNDFREDPAVPKGSATIWDYKGSGYDRGHLCAAGDMTFSRTAMSETFYMSNMSPQHRSFNRGIWKELEQQTRDWARQNDHLYVITGPVLGKRENKKIGDNRVSVPKAFYKVILDLKKPDQKAIAYMIPNEKQTKRLEDFEMSIDQLEKITDIDFFPALPDNQEHELESNYNPMYWIYDEERFKTRLSVWNNE